MESCPDLPLGDPRIVESGGQRVISSACWRGYQGTWEVRDTRFFLNEIRGRWKLQGEPMLANWFSGTIKIPQGGFLCWRGLDTAVYEQEVHIEVRAGLVVARSQIDNRPFFSSEKEFRVEGSWNAGVVLDWHTTDSQIVGQNEYGYPVFDTSRTELGALLYQFKYRSDQDALQRLLVLAQEKLASEKGKFDIVVPVPPSSPTRTVTSQIASGLGPCLGAVVSLTALRKIRVTDELKTIVDPARRRELLEGAFSADRMQLEGERVLLVDDLYRSGATLEAATSTVFQDGGAASVAVLAITRTRVTR